MSKVLLQKVVDHTFLHNETHGFSLEQQQAKVHELVMQAHKYSCFSVCMRESMVAYAKDILDSLSSKVKITSVIGFPDGNKFSAKDKIKLLEKARSDGADEFDMVLRHQDLIAGNDSSVLDDILQVSDVAGDQVLKVIFENSYLSEDQIKKATAICLEAFEKSAGSKNGFFTNRFIKTSTGYADCKNKGAMLNHVKLMYKESQGAVGIKPAGGIADYDVAQLFFAAVSSPMKDGIIDPYKFRIGSSSLLLQ